MAGDAPFPPGSPDDAALRDLARDCGVQTDYVGHDGVQVNVPAATLVAVLAALDIDASSAQAVTHARQDREDAPWRRLLPVSVVTREGWWPDVAVHVPDGASVHVWVELENGGGRDLVQRDVYVPPREVDGELRGRATFQIPGDLPAGYHTLAARSGEEEARTPLIVCPHRAPTPQRTAWGVMAQMYSVRSPRSWGMGDAVDLAELSELAARRLGADFMMINPVHAAEPVPPLTPSPYLPTTRQFLAPAYIRPEAIPEAAYMTADDERQMRRLADEVKPADLTGGLIDRDTSWSARLEVLWSIYQVPRSAARRDALAEFRSQGGQPLEDFALWCALYREQGPLPWPEELASPDASGVPAARERLAEDIDFFVWLQWVADAQFGAAQRQAKSAGMALGVMQDLAVGVHPRGADAWTQQGLLARGVAVGAPPDMYNQLGQDWSQPPWRPDALAASGYAAFREVVRAAMRHSGAIRIDHVLGLFRLWWIPSGFAASDGAYVTYDHEAMVGIVCLEAQRHGVVVIGEDLGTYEHWVSDYLAERGLLGTSVLWFEHDWDGKPKAPEAYRHSVLATVTTHDLPPTGAYLAGAHVQIRANLGLLARPVEDEWEVARAERDAMVDALRDRGLIGPEASEDDIVVALYAYIAQSPSVLRGVALVDLVGDRIAQNQPGTDTEYPNWKVPLADETGSPVSLDDVCDSPLARRIAEVMSAGNE